MVTIVLKRQIAAPVALVWRLLHTMSFDDTGMTTAKTEVLGGTGATLLSSRLLSGAPVRRNVVSVQIAPEHSRLERDPHEGSISAIPSGILGVSRRRVRHLLAELMARLEDAGPASARLSLERQSGPPDEVLVSLRTAGPQRRKVVVAVDTRGRTFKSRQTGQVPAGPNEIEGLFRNGAPIAARISRARARAGSAACGGAEAEVLDVRCGRTVGAASVPDHEANGLDAQPGDDGQQDGQIDH